MVEALKHGGISCKAKVEITWIDSEELNEKNLDQTLHKVDGILVPGGFGNRGTEGMILAAQYARCLLYTSEHAGDDLTIVMIINIPQGIDGDDSADL